MEHVSPGAGRNLKCGILAGQRTRPKQKLSNNMERGVLKQRDGKRLYRVLQDHGEADAEIM